MYLSLLGGATLFVRQNILDFIQGSTGYSTTQEQISLSDLPSLVLCWELGHAWTKISKYGTDFTIDFKVIEQGERTITLNENNAVKTSFGIAVKVSELYLSRKRQIPCPYINWKGGQCFKIDTDATTNDQIDMKILRIQVALMFSKLNYAPFRLRATFATSENSYGLVGGRWYDGEVECRSMSSGDSFSIEKVAHVRISP